MVSLTLCVEPCSLSMLRIVLSVTRTRAPATHGGCQTRQSEEDAFLSRRRQNVTLSQHHVGLSIAVCCRRLAQSGAPAQGSEHWAFGAAGRGRSMMTVHMLRVVLRGRKGRIGRISKNCTLL